ncbi:Alpha-amylase 3 [Nymphaea thermarum]|nr:Alpha-amylase 3 [Nymphaea thermarum]
MATLRVRPPLYQFRRTYPRFVHKLGGSRPSSLSFSRSVSDFRCLCNCKLRGRLRVSAGLAESFVEAAEAVASEEVVLRETFPLKVTQKVEGKVYVRVDNGKDDLTWKLTIGCNLPGKWVLHWGVTYNDEIGSEWDQPPAEMRPPGSVPIKDYAVETSLRKSTSSDGEQELHEIQIDVSNSYSIAAVHFVLKEEETGAWYQHRGGDFRVHFVNSDPADGHIDSNDKSFKIWPVLDQMSNMLLKTKGSQSKGQGEKKMKQNDGIYEEYPILKETIVDGFLSISVQESKEMKKRLVFFDTDLSGDIIVHWGVCKDDKKRWEIPSGPHPPKTHIFRKKALRTFLQPKEDGSGSWGLFSLDRKLSGLLFVLKVNEYTWVNNMGNDFYIPFQSQSSLSTLMEEILEEAENEEFVTTGDSDLAITDGALSIDESSFTDGTVLGTSENEDEGATDVQYTNEIINEIRNLVSDISAERSISTKSKEAHESILQEIEKLAAEAYSIFRSSRPTFSEETIAEVEASKEVAVSSGTGTGYEILCQGFNWESHKSGKWYLEMHDKAAELASLGFTVVWLPPPTESVSPEGYMPKDLYNLNSRYGTMEELKSLVARFHDVGIKVLGDVVLNHRCAHSQNQNGIWNVFGGKLAWDARAIVADDPHFQGRGNKSSGDNFHAAPNIDHSQEFVRNDIKEWLCWLRKEIGYDGWRLDFVRGFWGGYVKDYMSTSEPYFAVGEYWDSLCYTYGNMDHNQDGHRQRIVDWINATNGTAGAFDVTTKGILHSVLDKCEYWRLCDQKGKPAGVVGWWPSRAVTFIENHDTGSTQGHWRFPAGKEMQGYAYILTHPGTPAVFYDHVFSHLKGEIAALISLRNRAQINCRSTVQINRAERDVYAATIDDKVVMKIGPGYHEPPRGSKNWILSLQGKDYQIWEAL